MNTTTAYTPLECLLLFQSLVTCAAEEQDFDRISHLLTNNALVQDGETYDAQRLTPDALREFYLHLLRDELKSEEQEGQEDAGQTTSKKRKAPSPSIPSVKDALEYRDRLPLLVDRLYARYREYMVQAIQEDERRYAVLQQEIAEIERGEWDERINEESPVTASQNGAAQTSSPKTNGVPAIAASPENRAAGGSSKESVPEEISSPRPESRSEGLAISDVLNSQENPPPAASPKVPEHARPTGFPPDHQRNGSIGPHGPSPLQPPPGSHQPGGWKWETPYGPGHQPPPYQPGASYPPFNSPQYGPPQVYPQARPGSFSSPHGLPPPHPHVPSSPVNPQHPPPILLPPPNSVVHRSPSSPGMPLEALADMASQQYRQPSGSPMMQQGPSPLGYQQPFTPQQRPSSGNARPGQWNQNQQFVPPYPPPPLQPFPYVPPNQRPPFPPQPNLIQPENRQYNSPYNASQGPKPIQAGSSRPRPSLPNTPLARALPIFTTGSGTKWTPTLVGSSTPKFANAKVQRPQVEPLSPVQRPAKLPEPLQPSEPPKSSDQPAEKVTKKTPNSKPPPRGVQSTRAGSTASSVIAGSYRSQSVMSHADEMSVDNDRSVKEEVATPIGIVEDTGDTTADELPRLPSRSGPSPLKRKRASSIESRTPSTPATTVNWAKNFGNISKPALEAITSHKSASTFAHPVKPRDAPGYDRIIRRPQDLKSIRSAILAGDKSAKAALVTFLDDTNPHASSAKLPISEDLIPPKGIINSAQLEKEVYRMFANAIMFNPDPDRGLGRKWRDGIGVGGNGGEPLGYEIDEDSVVKDTKQMFADVEKIIGNLKAADRSSGEGMNHNWVGVTRDSSIARGSTVAEEDDDGDEAAGDGESHAGNTGSMKRRKKA